MRILLLGLLLFLQGCVYSPWKEEIYSTKGSFVTRADGPFENGNLHVVITAVPQERTPRTRSGPYRLVVTFIDHSMLFDSVEVLDLTIKGSLGQAWSRASPPSEELKEGKYQEGVTPYAKKAEIVLHESIVPNFEKKEKIELEFRYELKSDTESNGDTIRLTLEPILRKGRFELLVEV